MGCLIRKDNVLALETKGTTSRAWLKSIALYLLGPAVGAALVDL